MNLRVFLAVIWAALIGYPAFAQQPDNAAILNAIQGLSGRIDGLQKDVDNLKSSSTPTSSAVPNAAGRPAPAASPTVTSSRATGKAVPGWLVNVVPGDDDAKDSVITFGGPLSDFNFGLHSKLTDAKNEFSYQGSGFFHPKQGGRYVFIINSYGAKTCCDYQNYQFNCSVNFKIADNAVVSGQTGFLFYDNSGNFPENHLILKNQSFSGGADLDSVDYKVTFYANCYVDDRHKGETLNSLFPAYRYNKFSILVKRPDDDAARPFEKDEIFHIGKKKS